MKEQEDRNKIIVLKETPQWLPKHYEYLRTTGKEDSCSIFSTKNII
ncbi:MAG: hypothetical protein PHP31_06995 [Lentimicrobiaceae bacterium]|nr:hypothetical protein [Lentimicrobiaceae bacterium]